MDTKQNDQTNQNKDNIVPEPKYVNIVFSGGSVRGICHVGALQRLIHEKMVDLKKIKAVAAVSAGSLFSVLLVLGFSVEEIWHFILSIDLRKTVQPDFFLLLKKCGVDNGRIIYNLYEEILTKKTGIKHINFKQLYDITKIHLTIIGSCLTTKKTIYYDHINTPFFKVSVAVRISISMPGFFTPVIVDNKKYIDGAILNNYPMDIFVNELDRTVGIMICEDYDTSYEYPEQYFMAVLNLFMHHYYVQSMEKYKNNTILVNGNMENVNIFNFNLDIITKHKLYMCGYEAAGEFIQQQREKERKKTEQKQIEQIEQIEQKIENEDF